MVKRVEGRIISCPIVQVFDEQRETELILEDVVILEDAEKDYSKPNTISSITVINTFMVSSGIASLKFL